MENRQKNRDSIEEIHVLDYVDVLIKSRWVIIRNVFLTAVLVALISLLLPRKYDGITTLMPPQEQENSSVAGMLSDVAVPGLAMPSSTSFTEILVEMLKSRSVGERVLNRRFSCRGDTIPLLDCLHAATVETGLLLLHSDIAQFSMSKQGIITIKITLSDPQLAADVANAFVEELDRINQEKSVSRAKNSRIYIESQLRETEEKLNAAARALASFQQEHKAVSLEEQTRAMIQSAAEIKGQIDAKIVELGVLLQTRKPENVQVIRVRRELEELQQRYEAMQYGETSLDMMEGEFLPFSNMPELGLQLAELTREAKVQETVWQLLNQQYYQAKIDEARDTPTVQVLDVAVPSTMASSPNRKALVLVFTLLSFVFSVVWAFGCEYVSNLDDHPEDKQRLERIFGELKKDWQTIRARFGKKDRTGRAG